ncbi:hypothetical protein K437DRAFT_22432 [Tilletiaria anomala UBC 951]|uniref:Uncharacterized protein n=1 Tax=Tilletiaria anomala (strain ATCC 24038 / CBS 436.72 / UBC 951) TaxID=1037660 RepID=A0A066VIL9_TILAU|nr:uncharacterized protein K437DRAFT_22432 [Tilletiaria anomala UBC 951]KDN38579.1 hypothetical protein K437DRAFT_22432 [Tilletiaria anomala UBC 951]
MLATPAEGSSRRRCRRTSCVDPSSSSLSPSPSSSSRLGRKRRRRLLANSAACDRIANVATVRTPCESACKGTSRTGATRRRAISPAAAAMATALLVASALVQPAHAVSSSLYHVDCQTVNWTIIIDQYDAPFDIIELYVGNPPYLDGSLNPAPPVVKGKNGKSKKVDKDDEDSYGFATNFTASQLGLPSSGPFFIKDFDLDYGRTLKLDAMQPVGFRLYDTNDPASNVTSSGGSSVGGCAVLAANGYAISEVRGNEIMHDFSMCKHVGLPFSVSNNTIDYGGISDSDGSSGAASSINGGRGGLSAVLSSLTMTATATVTDTTGATAAAQTKGGSERLAGPNSGAGTDNNDGSGPGKAATIGTALGSALGALLVARAVYVAYKRYTRSERYRRRKRAAILWEQASEGAGRSSTSSDALERYCDDPASSVAPSPISSASSSSAGAARPGFSGSRSSGSGGNGNGSRCRSVVMLQLDTSPAALTPAMTRGRLERPPPRTALSSASVSSAAGAAPPLMPYSPLTLDEQRELGLLSGGYGSGSASATERWPDNEHELNLHELAMSGPPPEYAASVRSTEVVLSSPVQWTTAPPPPPQQQHGIQASPISPSSAVAPLERTFLTAAYNSPFTWQGPNPFARHAPLPPIPQAAASSSRKAAANVETSEAMLSPFSDRAAAEAATDDAPSASAATNDADDDADASSSEGRSAHNRTPSVAGTTRLFLEAIVNEDNESDFWTPTAED